MLKDLPYVSNLSHIWYKAYFKGKSSVEAQERKRVQQGTYLKSYDKSNLPLLDTVVVRTMIGECSSDDDRLLLNPLFPD